MKIFYLPLEAYRERYTWQLSSKGGWTEKAMARNGVAFTRIEGQRERTDGRIKYGQVLDAFRRPRWACSQIVALLTAVEQAKLRDEAVVLLEDFWHPGFSALPYTLSMTKRPHRIYAFLWAQSVDPFDFTYPMRDWMRHFEIGEGKVLDGIFVASTSLRDLCVHAGIGTADTVHVVGLPFDTREVRRRAGRGWKVPRDQRPHQVVFSSRWDSEKNPRLFMDLARKMMPVYKSMKFVVTTSAKTLRSNQPSLVEEARRLQQRSRGRFRIEEGLTKEQYYQILCESRVQVNTADQDFVSFTLLEATACGCRPLYPYHLSFPETLNFRTDLMYQHKDLQDLVERLQESLFPDDDGDDYSWVCERHDGTLDRVMRIIKGGSSEAVYRDPNVV